MRSFLQIVNDVFVQLKEVKGTDIFWKESEVKYWGKSGAPCESIGFYFGANKKYITLYMNKSPEEFGELMNIPISCITKIKLL